MNKYILITLALVSINSFAFGMDKRGLFAKPYGNTKRSPKKPSQLSAEARCLIQASIAQLEAEGTRRAAEEAAEKSRKAAEEAARPIDLTQENSTPFSRDPYEEVIARKIFFR